jgi:FkbM family methyltransferase
MLTPSSEFWIHNNNHTEPTYKFVPDKDRQAEQLNMALKYVRSFRNCIDIGSNIGLWTRYLAKKFQHVYCFEPNETYINCFNKNITDKNITLYKNGLSEKEHYATQDKHSTVLSTEPGNILCKTLDSYEFTDIDFIKIDVDGFEHLVLNGARNTLQKNNPVINIELKGDKSDSRNKSTQRCRDLLREYGYNYKKHVKHDEIWAKTL